MNIHLRQRKKGDKISLYLDYYQGGFRKTEYLKLYLTPEPLKGRLSKEEKSNNERTLELANAIKLKRIHEYTMGRFGLADIGKQKSNFIQFVELVAHERNTSKGNKGNWYSMLIHLRNYAHEGVTFQDVNKEFLEGFKRYLDQVRQKTGKQLSSSSKSAYFNKLRAALKEAVRREIIHRNPAEQVKGISVPESIREWLTLEELNVLAQTDCEIPILKRAFLFSCATGLRHSDIKALRWSNVFEEAGSTYIRIRQEKTKSVQILKMNQTALDCMGTRPNNQESLVFYGLNSSSWHNTRLKEWLLRAGITKKITFHCARHTFASLQLDLHPEQIALVKSMLGHKDIKTTMIYAKHKSIKMEEAMDKLKFDIKW
jgi:integrase